MCVIEHMGLVCPYGPYRAARAGKLLASPLKHALIPVFVLPSTIGLGKGLVLAPLLLHLFAMPASQTIPTLGNGNECARSVIAQQHTNHNLNSLKGYIWDYVGAYYRGY